MFALTDAERARVLQLLDDSRAEFLGLTSGLSEAQWTYQPAAGLWSVGEIAEHLVLAEGLLFAKMEEALAGPPNPDWEARTARKTEFIEQVLPERRRKARAPAPLQPRGQWTPAQTIAAYQAGRAKTLQFTAETVLSLKNHTSEHPFPIFNTLSAYQWLLYIPLHNERHDQQILEVRSSAAFPKP